ncbi:MAG: type II toxin-antitoxin system VapB family antitoxin [Thermomicrobiales bacterium]
METIVDLDEKLLERAIRISGIEKKDEVLREALTALIDREAARRVIELAGTEPNLMVPPRKRPNPA